jgi:hypothetical protein
MRTTKLAITFLRHHPAKIVGWTGCNECEQTPAEVMSTVAEEDNSRVIRGACPFGLYTSGVHTLTGLPNGQPLRWTQNWHDQNCDNHALWCNKTGGDSAVPWQGGAEQHGPYNNGNGGMWRTINSNGGGGLFTDPALLVAVQPGFLVSAGQPGYFKSETGCTSLSSYESMAATLTPTEYGVNTEPFRERNYASNSLILSYFGAHRDMSAVGVEALQSQTYLSMLAASLERKSDIESWRSTGIWGMLMWQLNEIWPVSVVCRIWVLVVILRFLEIGACVGADWRVGFAGVRHPSQRSGARRTMESYASCPAAVSVC